jgi:hypothetical protein
MWLTRQGEYAHGGQRVGHGDIGIFSLSAAESAGGHDNAFFQLEELVADVCRPAGREIRAVYDWAGDVRALKGLVNNAIARASDTPDHFTYTNMIGVNVLTC